MAEMYFSHIEPVISISIVVINLNNATLPHLASLAD